MRRKFVLVSALAIVTAAACDRAPELSTASSGADPDDGSAGPSGGTSGKGGALPTTPEPEIEAEESYTAPIVSGRFIWTANPLSGRVALIDAEDLTVRTAEVGLAPTYLAALGESTETESAAVVLNVMSRDASILRANSDEIGVETAPVHDGANRVTVSASGRWVLVWSDARLVPDADATEGMQDVTVLDLAGAAISSRRLTVGYRPSRVVIEESERAAYVVAEPGVSVIELSDDEPPEVVRDVPVTDDPTEAASARDVTVTADGELAFVRREGSRDIDIVSLSDGRARTVTLPAPVTDLDLSPDGKLAFAVARGQAAGNPGAGGAAGSGGRSGEGGAVDPGAVAGASGNPWLGSGGAGAGGVEAPPAGDAGAGSGGEAPAGAGGAGSGGEAPAGAGGAVDGGGQGGEAPEANAPEEAESFVAVLPVREIFEKPDAYRLLPIPEVVGSIAVAPAGDVAVLFTTVGGNDRLTILDTAALASQRGVPPAPRTVVVKAPVRAVLPSTDGEHAVVLLGMAPGSQKPGGFSLVPLKTALPPKIVGTDAAPAAVGIGEHDALITIDAAGAGGAGLHGVYLARFPELSTKLVPLASPTLSAALVPAASIGFVAQAHPEGRITFLDLASGAPRTITGFELSAQVIE